jgi:hypothetical protein
MTCQRRVQLCAVHTMHADDNSSLRAQAERTTSVCERGIAAIRMTVCTAVCARAYRTRTRMIELVLAQSHTVS